MNGDFSRRTRRHAATRQYDRVELQQGRVLLDADWNEQASSATDRARRTGVDVVGGCGIPRGDPGFTLVRSANDLTVTSGRAWVGGAEVLNPADVSVAVQPFGGFDPLAMPGNGPWVAYLEVWERFVGADEDERLLEPALGGPDTATRIQKAWRVGVAAITDNQRVQLLDGLRPNLPAWRATNAELGARVAPPGAAPANRPCLLPPQAGYVGPENQLYRIEVHRGGNRANARFKVSAENGSVRARVREAAGVRTLAAALEDSGFRTGDWVELVSDDQLLAGSPGSLHRLTVNPDRTVSFQPAPQAGVDGQLAIRWDHGDGDQNGLTIPPGWADLTEGIQVNITGTFFRAGDFWTVPARTATGLIEWPPATNVLGAGDQAVAPDGPWRAFCPLHILSPTNGAPVVGEALITEFPPLTAIEARDVDYDNSRVDIGGAEDVQEALENLAGLGHGSCTRTAAPGADLQSVVDSVPAGTSARICLAVGDYHLAAPLNIDGLASVELVGAGHGTHLVMSGHETTVRFSRCHRVRLADLHITSAAERVEQSGRNGAVHVADCGRTIIESVAVTRRVDTATALVLRSPSVTTRRVRHAADLAT